MRYEVQAFQNAPGRNGSIYYLLSWKININCERNFWITRLAGCWLEILRRAEEWSGQTMEIFVTPSPAQPSPAQGFTWTRVKQVAGQIIAELSRGWPPATGLSTTGRGGRDHIGNHGTSKTPTLPPFCLLLAALWPFTKTPDWREDCHIQYWALATS